MTHDTPPPGPPDDARDPELAALLAVPPLDDVTRRRLVRTAVDATSAPPVVASTRSKSRLGAAMGVAAALAVGAIVGAVVVTRPSEPDTPSAARASSTVPSTAPAAAEAEAGAPAPQSADDQVSGEDPAGAPPQELGDLGVVRGAAALRQAIEDSFEQGGASEPRAVTPAPPCRNTPVGTLGLVAITAAGEAQLDGLPVVVLVGPTPQGEDQALALDPARGCTTVARVTL
jgi:hypothetical protein